MRGLPTPPVGIVSLVSRVHLTRQSEPSGDHCPRHVLWGNHLVLSLCVTPHQLKVMGGIDRYDMAIMPHPWRLVRSLRRNGGVLAVS
jgi:hypothetical protein